MKERGYLPAVGVKVLSATVSERAGRWFVSLQVEMEMPDPPPQGERTEVVGVDLGVVKLATLSDGVTIDNPKALRTNLRKVKRLQRTVSRRQKGGANRRKAVQQLARAHLRVANIRQNALHQVTSALAKTKSCSSLNIVHLVLELADLDYQPVDVGRQLRHECFQTGNTLFHDQIG